MGASPPGAPPDPAVLVHGRGGRRRAHLPTGRVSVESVLRLLLHDLDVTPRRDDWREVLDRGPAISHTGDGLGTPRGRGSPRPPRGATCRLPLRGLCGYCGTSRRRGRLGCPVSALRVAATSGVSATGSGSLAGGCAPAGVAWPYSAPGQPRPAARHPAVSRRRRPKGARRDTRCTVSRFSLRSAGESARASPWRRRPVRSTGARALPSPALSPRPVAGPPGDRASAACSRLAGSAVSVARPAGIGGRHAPGGFTERAMPRGSARVVSPLAARLSARPA